jgi:hypothetical protein
VENTAQGNPGWALRRRPGHWHANSPSGPSSNPAEVPILVQTDKITSTTMSSISRGGKRGNKIFAKGGDGRIKEELSESDNYPPDFKARLAQLVSKFYT